MCRPAARAASDELDLALPPDHLLAQAAGQPGSVSRLVSSSP